MAEASHYVAIDIHKTDSRVDVLDDRGEVVEECRIEKDNPEEIARKYEGSNATLEATGNYFTIYDTLAEHLEVTLVNPVKAHWLDRDSQKTDRFDANQLARFLRLDEVPESYVPPMPIRRYRSLARGRKKLTNKQTDFKNEVHVILDKNGVAFTGSLW